MSDFHSLVDHIRFDLVRRLVNQPGSPITDLLFVESHTLLCELAGVLTQPASGAGRQRLQHWFESGRVSVGTTGVGHVSSGWERLDLHSIDRHARCDVLYLPPYYLVHLTGDLGSSCATDLHQHDGE